ncbi:hypothetical protein [Pseudophaeobacter leonis]|uniref:hypothetical protein n=1 Tax=Pseudophaeobacter leonis TaxID=1144477 RepID=UPI0009F6EF61|nr:hypothetical protein [Pseudophaeobacter leonis]
MAQVENFKGKLGFEQRSEEKLKQALTELLDTLEEFGHPALQINARDPHRIGLDCDQYKVTLRLRRIPLRLGVRTPQGLPAPAAYIELVMTPNFPTGCDTEISEILLAMILRRLTETLDPLVIFWQDSVRALTTKDFLGAFEPASAVETQPPAASAALVTSQPQPQQQNPAQPQDLAPYALLEQARAVPPGVAKDLQAPQASAAHNRWSAETLIAEMPGAQKPTGRISAATARLKLADKARAEADAERSRGQMRFGSVEDGSTVLEQHCNEIQMLLPHPKARHKIRQNRQLPPPKQRAKSTYQSIFGQSRLSWLLAIPRALLSATLNAVRSIDLVLSVRALITAMVVLFLHGSGMVQAAARVLMP